MPFRWMRPWVAGAVAATLAASCSATTSGGRKASSSPAPRAAGAPSVPATTVPPSTTTTTIPPLPAPAAITPLVSPPAAGEGAWAPAGDRLARGYAIYTTQLRPGPGLPPAGIAWIDSAATRIALYAGTSEPQGSWTDQGDVAAAQRPTLMAGFDSGFKIYSYRTGWYDGGRTAMPLQNGAASLVISTDGTATVAEWGRDATLTPSVAAVRQNLTLLVDHGAPVPRAAVPSDWGAVLGGGVYTWRSGVGVTAAGDLVFAGGPKLDPLSLARLLVAAGAQRAMEMDINPEWVSFASFTHTGGIGGAGLSGANFLPGMYFGPSRYLEPFSRDFFAVFSR